MIKNVPQRWTGHTAHKRRAIRRGARPRGREGEDTARDLLTLGRAGGLEDLECFRDQFWCAWMAPAWVLRDLYGEIHRRTCLAEPLPARQLGRVCEGCWRRLERRCGHLSLQNVVAAFRNPEGMA